MWVQSRFTPAGQTGPSHRSAHAISSKEFLMRSLKKAPPVENAVCLLCHTSFWKTRRGRICLSCRESLGQRKRTTALKLIMRGSILELRGTQNDMPGLRK